MCTKVKIIGNTRRHTVFKAIIYILYFVDTYARTKMNKYKYKWMRMNEFKTTIIYKEKPIFLVEIINLVVLTYGLKVRIGRRANFRMSKSYSQNRRSTHLWGRLSYLNLDMTVYGEILDEKRLSDHRYVMFEVWNMARI